MGIVATDSEGIIRLLNVGAERLLDAEAGEVLNKVTLEDVQRPPHGSPPHAADENSRVYVASGPDDDRELTYFGKDTDDHPAVMAITRLRDDSGASLGDLLIGTRQFGQGPGPPTANLRESQELFRLAVETCPAGIVMVDVADNVIMVNSATEHMFGRSRGDLLGQPIDILVPRQLREHQVLARDGFKSQSESVRAEVCYDLIGRRKDATEFPVEVTLNPVQAGDDILILNLMVDTSKKREAERHLAQMEARYRGLLEAAPDAIVVVDAAGMIVLLNIQAEKQFGYRRAELVGQKVTNIIPEGFAERLLTDALRSTEDALAQQIDTGIELSGLRKNGSAFPIEIMLSPLESQEGLLVTAAIRDITARRHLERLKDEFVSTVSHELRTPLTSISAALGLLTGSAGGKLPDPAARLIEIAHLNCQRLVRLINDILDVEKLESGQVIFSQRPLDVHSIVDQAIEANRGFAESYCVRVRLESGHDALAVRADPDRLLQVLVNLLSNATKFSPLGGEVTVTIQPRDHAVRIAFRDTGPGIPDHFRSRVFEKFAQADATDARQKGGTGLGLSIVKQITTRLGGEVGFANAEGGGAIFYIDLPSVDSVVAGEVVGDDRSDTSRMVDLGGLVSQPIRRPAVLHVDDDPDSLQLVAQLFGSTFDLVSVNSLGEARREIKIRHFDLAVLDIGLGADSGLDLLADLHDADDKAIPVIIFSVRSADVTCGSQIHAALDKSPASVKSLLANVRDRLELSRFAH